MRATMLFLLWAVAEDPFGSYSRKLDAGGRLIPPLSAFRGPGLTREGYRPSRELCDRLRGRARYKEITAIHWRRNQESYAMLYPTTIRGQLDYVYLNLIRLVMDRYASYQPCNQPWDNKYIDTNFHFFFIYQVRKSCSSVVAQWTANHRVMCSNSSSGSVTGAYVV